MAYRNIIGLLMGCVAACALASCSGSSEEPAAEQQGAAATAASKDSKAAAAPTALNQGDWVLAPWRNSVNLFPGVVAATDGTTITVRFDDGTTDTRQLGEVRVFDWRAGTGIECQWTDGGWYDATILTLAEDGYTMRVRYDDDGIEQDTNTGKCRTRT